jgi:lambda family phage tail tape measure protein
MMDQGKFLRLLQQQPEFRSPAGTGSRVAPLTVPALTSGTRAAGGGGGSSRAPTGQIIEYLTGDRGSSSYRADHGGSNYHDHLAFGSTAQRDAAMKALRAAGIRIGSVNDGRHARGSYHYSDQAFDVPGSQVPAGQEAALSALVRKVLGGAGFVGKGIGKAAGYADDLASLRLQGEEKAAEAARKAKEDDKRKAEETAKQLTAARDLLATKEAQLQVAAAMTPLEKLSVEYDQARAERMRDYADKLAAAKSDQERELLVKSQITDWARQELEHKQKLTDLTGQQLTQERERAELLADSMARMQELTSRSSAGAGFQQGLQGYVDSVGNLRDAVGQLTTDSIGGLEDSLTELATTGTTNFKAFAASVLQDTSRMIIRQLVLKTIMQIIGGIGGGAGSSFEMPSQAFIPSGGYGFARGGIFGGDMVTSPTMFKFATGGAFRTGVMGEAGPEAIMPLRRGRDGRLGVAAAGGTSNAITINVDASGTKASGDQGTGAALARDLARVVDDRLIHHRRPGGLLAA